MPNKNGWTSVALSPQIMDEYVMPVQQRILADTGIRISPAAVVRRLVELGAAADMSKSNSDMLSSAVN